MSSMTLSLSNRAVARQVRRDACRRIHVRPSRSPRYSASKIPWVLAGPSVSDRDRFAFSQQATAPVYLVGRYELSV